MAKIALLFPMDAPQVSWNLGRGIEATLRRMGYEVLAIPIPTTQPLSEHPQEQKRFRMMIEAKKKELPKIEDIARCDAVIVSGPEHVAPWIEEVYEKYEWTRIADVPKAAWLHESCERDDYQIDLEAIEWVAKEWFFPAFQDAERYGQEMFKGEHAHYLPFGVDEAMFHPWPTINLPPLHYFGVAFIGNLYQKRVAFLQALGRHDHPPIKIGNAVIQDLFGYQHEQSARRYVENIRDVKVFFALPSMSRLLVPRIFEVLACGTFLFAPLLPSDGGANQNLKLLDEIGIPWYRPSNLPHVAQMLHEWISPEKSKQRQEIAARGCEIVRREHTLEKRLAEMLAKLGVGVPQEIEATD